VRGLTRLPHFSSCPLSGPRALSCAQRLCSLSCPLALLTFFACTGCASGTAGLVDGEVLDGDGARLIVVHGYGLELRGHPVDAGLTLGFARQIYIYPSQTSGLPELGRYWFWVPQPEAAPLAWESLAVGLDIRTASTSIGLTLGYGHRAVLAYLPADDTVAYRLRFTPSSPASTFLRHCQGETECSTSKRVGEAK